MSGRWKISLTLLVLLGALFAPLHARQTETDSPALSLDPTGTVAFFHPPTWTPRFEDETRLLFSTPDPAFELSAEIRATRAPDHAALLAPWLADQAIPDWARVSESTFGPHVAWVAQGEARDEAGVFRVWAALLIPPDRALTLQARFPHADLNQVSASLTRLLSEMLILPQGVQNATLRLHLPQAWQVGRSGESLYAAPILAEAERLSLGLPPETLALSASLVTGGLGREAIFSGLNPLALEQDRRLFTVNGQESEMRLSRDMDAQTVELILLRPAGTGYLVLRVVGRSAEALLNDLRLWQAIFGGLNIVNEN